MVEEIKDDMKSHLYRLVAQIDDIDEKEITVEYIRQQREELIYPNARYNIGSDYGGYDNTCLKVVTRNEFKEIEKEVNERQKEILDNL